MLDPRDTRDIRSRLGVAPHGPAAVVPLLAGALALTSLTGCTQDDDSMAMGDRPAPVGVAGWDPEREQVATAGWVVTRPEPGGGGEMAVQVPGPLGGDGLVVRRTQPDEIRAGEPLNYAIIVENTGSTMMRDIWIEEWRQGDLEIENVSFSGASSSRAASGGERAGAEYRQGSADGGSNDSWWIDSLAPGETERIRIEGIAPDEGEITTCMTITYEPAVCMVTEVVQPDLSIRRLVAEDSALVCDAVEVTYVVENSGTAAARNVILREQLPSGLLTAEGGETVRFAIPSLAAGESVERTAMLTAEAPGEYASYATLASRDAEARSRESTLAFSQPELELEVDAPRSEYVGRNIPVRMTLRNVGDAPAVGTTVRVPGLSNLPQASLSSRNAAIAGELVEWGRLGPGDERTVTLTFFADEPMSREMQFVADAACAEPVRDSLQFDVVGVSAIRVETIDLKDPVVVGEQTVYEVQVKNQGSADAVNVSVDGTLPAEMSFVRGEGESRVRNRGQDVTMDPVPTLAPGEVATWLITVRADEPANVQFRLEVRSDATRAPAIESEPTTIIRRPATAGDGG